MLRLDEYERLMAMHNVEHVLGVQCAFGALAAKLTSLFTCNISFIDMPSTCTHTPTTW